MDYKPSRFNARTLDDDGTLILYNSMTGAIAGVPPVDVNAVRNALKNESRSVGPLEGILEELTLGGFLVPAEKDEDAALQSIIDTRINGQRKLHMILLPTEDCNFRCVYCYEHFKRHKMEPQVQDSVVNWLENNINQFESVHFEWFGGEPLHAADVVLSLGKRLKRVADANNVYHVASMTTNGYSLTPKMMQQLLEIDCYTFTVTLDGVQADHDTRRVLKGGGNTFETITNNLKALKASDLDFKLRIRHNFDPKSIPQGDEFLAYLTHHFAGDHRFSDVNFRMTSKWDGPNDDALVVCDAKQSAQARYGMLHRALDNGFYEHSVKYYLQPHGYVCYASNPNSLVIGADGKIMKCTLELDNEDRNIVGQVHQGGRFEIDAEKMAMWITSGSDDSGCHSCFLSPSCQGAACAKERFDHGHRPCPNEKRHLVSALKLMYRSETVAATLYPPVEHFEVATQDLSA
jgi:uncharacterized protein